MTYKMMFAAASVAALALAAPATASVAWGGKGATDTIDWSQFDEYAAIPTGTMVVSKKGRPALIGTSSETDAERRSQPDSWYGNFGVGAPLVWNRGSAGDITLRFKTPVRGVGAQFQADYYGEFTARATDNDGNFFDFDGTSNGNNDGSAVFVGIQSKIADISSITFHQQAGAGDNDFAIGNISLIAGGVPEPATWAMMIGGFGLVGGAMRRRVTWFSFA